MKKLAILILFSSIFASCSKDNPGPPASGDAYMSFNAGSTWNYKMTDNSTGTPTSSTYTLVSTSRADSIVNGISYHPFDRSTGGSEYYGVNGSDYYQLMALPADLGGQFVENLYLKPNVNAGTSWTQTSNVNIPGAPFPLTLTITNTIQEKGISRTVNLFDYVNVIHVKTSLSVAGIPPASLVTDIHSYYAPNVGLIENTTDIALDYMGLVMNVNTQLLLQSATIL